MASARGQGFVRFNNLVPPTVVAPIYGTNLIDATLALCGNATTNGGSVNYTGYSLLAGLGNVAQLWGGPLGAPDAALVPVSTTVAFRPAPNAGFIFAPPAVAVPGVPGGEMATVQVRAWDNRGGTVSTWAGALADPTVARGACASFPVGPLGTNAASASQLTNMVSFNIHRPTPPPVRLLINEWLADNTNGIVDPYDGQYDDWFEIYNPGTNEVSLDGLYLSDAWEPSIPSAIPSGYNVPAGGYLLVWADNELEQNSTNSPDLHVNFVLSTNGVDGQIIGLYAADGTVIDAITIGAQTPDVSEGRWPDGGANRYFMTRTTPRAANVLAPVITAQPQSVDVDFGDDVTFRVEALGTPPLTYEWRFIGDPAGISRGTNSTLSIPNAQPTNAGSYFVIVRNAFGTVASAVVVLAVGTDATPPKVVEAGADCRSNKVTIVFSEPLQAASAANAANYSFSPALTIFSASLSSDGLTVCLFTAPLSPATTYTLTIVNLKDLAGNTLTPNPTTVLVRCPKPCIDPFCITFDDLLPHGFDTAAGCPNDKSSGVDLTIAFGGPSGPLDPYLQAKDISGASVIYGGDVAGNWLCLASNACMEFCYDFRVNNDGSPGTLNIHPSFTLVSHPNPPCGPPLRAQWVANVTVTENGGANPGWHKVCAPIAVACNCNLPTSPNGSWQMLDGASPCRWNELLSCVTAIELHFDYTSFQTEDVCYDNFCFRTNCPPCTNPPPNMVLWLPFDEAAGPTAANLVAGGNPGTHQGAPVVVNEYVDRGLCFNGLSANYVNVPDYPAINFGTGDFSIDAWVKRSTTDNSTRTILDKRMLTGGKPVGYYLGLSWGNLILQLADGGAGPGYTNFRNTGGFVPADNCWHHVVVTVERNSSPNGIKFYIDGSPIGITGDPTLRPGSLSNSADLWVARTHIPGAVSWLGCVDEVELFNRVITQPEIFSIFNARRAGKCKPAWGMGPFVYTAGTNDNCALPFDLTFRSPCLNAYGAGNGGTWKEFDDPAVNHWVGHTFVGLPLNITRAELEVVMKPECDFLVGNDAIHLGLLGCPTPSGWAWGRGIVNLPEASGTWNCTDNPKTVFTLDLASLPLNVGTYNLLPKLNTDHYLDLRVQDDTVVDYMELRVWTNCLQIICPTNSCVTTCSNCAVVNYTVQVLDHCSPGPSQAQVACSWPSGSCFPIGTTKVTCTAYLNNGDCDTCCFTVTVKPYTGPELVCPEQIKVDCEEDNGAWVNYTVSASSVCCPPVSVSCIPLPGWFPMGVTKVTCIATDDCSLSSTCMFPVVVKGYGLPMWQCAQRFGAQPAFTSGNAIAVDRFGNFYIAATATFGFGLKDVAVFSYDPNWNLRWSASGSSTANDEALGIAVSDQDEVYVTGYFTGNATFIGGGVNIPVSSVASSEDVFVSKYNLNGVLQWVRTGGGPGSDRGTAAAVDTAGNCHITGYFSGLNANFSGTFHATTAPAEAFVASYTSGGTLTDFGRAIGNMGLFTIPQAIAMDAAGNRYITGRIRNNTGSADVVIFGSYALNIPANTERAFVARQDNQAVWSWAMRSAGAGNHAGYGIGVDGVGKVYVTGTFFNPSGSGAMSLGGQNVANTKLPPNSDFFLARLNANNGAVNWLKSGTATLPGGSPSTVEETRALAADAAGNFYITGFRCQMPTQPVTAGKDVLVAKYNTSGVLQWTCDGIGTPATCRNAGLGIAVDCANCVHVTGAFSDSLKFGPLPTLNSVATSSDGFAAKLCPKCGCEKLTHNLSTGLNNTNGALTANGQADDCWIITGKPGGAGGGTPPFPAVVVAPFTGWQLALPGSEWISVSSSYGPAPNGFYTNLYCFWLDQDFTNAVMDLFLRADDRVFDVRLNGNSICSGCPGGAYNGAALHVTSQSYPQSFFYGGRKNSLEVVVEDTGAVAVGLNVAGTITAAKGVCCARICGMKFNDKDHDGRKDSFEPGVKGFTIEVKDSSGNVVGTAVTDAQGNYCIKVPAPGNYTVSEVQQTPKWFPTTPQNVPANPTGPQTIIVNFGNFCEVPEGTVVRQRGLKDNYTGPFEPAFPGACMKLKYPLATWKNFDDPTIDRFVGHTFTGLPANIVSATLTVCMKSGGSQSDNDTINLGLMEHTPAGCIAGGPTWCFGAAIDTLPQSSPGCYTFALSSACCGKLATDRFLDVLIQDDHTVDWMRLTLRTCDKPIIHHGLVHEALGEATLLVSDTNALAVSLGSSGQDGVSIELGEADGWRGSLNFPAELSEEGVEFHSSVLGRVNGEDDQIIGQLHLTGTGSSASLTVDYSSAGSSNSVLQLYDANGAVLGTQSIANNSPIEIRGTRLSFIGWACGPGQIAVGESQTGVSPRALEDFSAGFTNAVQVIGPGGQPIGGVRALSVSAGSVTATRDFVSRVTLQAAGAESFELTDELVRKFGFFHGALGDATFDVNNGVTALLSTNGYDGVEITLGEAGDTTVGLTGLLSDSSSNLWTGGVGSMLEAAVSGSFNGVPNQRLGSVLFTLQDNNSAAPYGITADFNAINSPSQRIVVRSNGVDVAVFNGPTGPVGSCSNPPRFIGKTFGQTKCIRGDFPPGTLFVIDGQQIRGEQMFILAEPTSGHVDYHSEIALRARGLTEFTISDVQSAPPLVFTMQPQSMAVRPGMNVTFSSSVTSSVPVAYQWRFNGTNLAGATASSLTISNVQLSHEGGYAVVVSSAAGSITSDTATLTVLINPAITQQPLSQSVAPGSLVTLSVAITGNPAPFGYEWRRGATPLVSNTSPDYVNFFSFLAPNEVTSQQYRVVVRNPANPSAGAASAFATITVLADSDEDGIVDVWESQFGLNPLSAADRNLDADGDGMTNWEEYIAGTDATNAASYLTISGSLAGGGGATLQFGAISNRTYTIQALNTLGAPPWLKLADILARSSNHVETVVDPTITTNRFYRVVTPQQPSGP